MNGINRTGFFASIILAFLYLCSYTHAKELPIESFSQLPSSVRPNLSPNGSKIAYIKNYQKPELAVLVTFDLITGQQKFVIKSDNEESKINWFTWANEKTLIVSIRFASKRYRTDTTETRLVAIDIDGEEVVQRELVKPRRGAISDDHVSQFQDNVVSFLPDDPEHILIALDLDIANMPSVYKLNVNTGRRSRVTKGKLSIRDWMADR